MRKAMAAPSMASQSLLQARRARPGTRRRRRAIWREAASAFAEVTSRHAGLARSRACGLPSDGRDHAGARRPHRRDRPDGHERRGERLRLSSRPSAASRRRCLIGQRDRGWLTRGRPVSGAIGRKRHPAGAEREPAPARARRPAHRHRRDDRARRRSRPPSADRRRRRARTAPARSSSVGGRLASRSLDNRLGAYVALEAAHCKVADVGRRPRRRLAAVADSGAGGRSTSPARFCDRLRARTRRSRSPWT